MASGPQLAQPPERRWKQKQPGIYFAQNTTATLLGWLSALSYLLPPQWFLQPHFFMSPHPVTESAAHTSHKGQNFHVMLYGKILKKQKLNKAKLYPSWVLSPFS